MITINKKDRIIYAILEEEELNMTTNLEAAPVQGQVCSNCGATGAETLVGLPEGWVEVRIKSGQGIHLDSVVCDDCRKALNVALADRRTAVSGNSLQQKVTNAREAGEETIKVTQKGSGRETTVKVSEFDEPKEAVEPVKAPKAATARRSAAVKDMSVDAAPVAEASGKTGPNATGSVADVEADSVEETK